MLIHQLPGLALFAYKYYHPPAAAARYLPSLGIAVDSLPRYSFRWSFLAPLSFYLLWQIAYFLIVQVGLLQHGGRKTYLSPVSSLTVQAVSHIQYRLSLQSLHHLFRAAAEKGAARHDVSNLFSQVISRKFIKANGYDTSYSCLARRAVKTNNFWNRTVRKGSSLRRVMMFGRSFSDDSFEDMRDQI